jgi:hypothetical protein
MTGARALERLSSLSDSLLSSLLIRDVVGLKSERIHVHERKVAAMLNKARLFPGILACMLALAFIAQASAGEVKLVSDTMDIVCRV